MQILFVGDTHVLSCEIRSVNVLLFVVAPAFIEALNSKEYVAAFNNLGAIPEITFPEKILIPVLLKSVSEFPVLFTEIKV